VPNHTQIKSHKYIILLSNKDPSGHQYLVHTTQIKLIPVFQKSSSTSTSAQAQQSATRLQAYNLNGGSNEELREKRSTTACSEVICMPAQPSSPWQQPAALHKHK
jgi:hypothetical protein